MSAPDNLTIAMQNEVIKISQERLGYTLSDELKKKIQENRWSYMGLEMMIDTVKSIDVEKSKII